MHYALSQLADISMQHIAHELYRQQIMQRIPDPYPSMLPIPIPRHIMLPPRVSLPGVEAKLENNNLWKEFCQIGTEMIITKSGRRMFPSMRLSLSGLEENANYFVILEMVPVGDCRYKFSGSQWVPAGGSEPQSPLRIYVHPESPALGSHWQAQPILFNKVKLTNNTLDNNGHIVLTSMHKYQPRIHVVRTSDPTRIPIEPQQAFIFPETEFVAVTAYQNDRITKLKIDYNPFAKGFRETGQSRCKRKLSPSSSPNSSAKIPHPDIPIKIEQTSNNNNSIDDINNDYGKRLNTNLQQASPSSSIESGNCLSHNSSRTNSPENLNDDIRIQYPVNIKTNYNLMHQLNQSIHKTTRDSNFGFCFENPFYTLNTSTNYYTNGNIVESPVSSDVVPIISPPIPKKCNFSISAILGEEK